MPDFLEHRDNWILWRSLGHEVEGQWVAPVSFKEAQEMPKKMLDTFLTLDNYFGKMSKQWAKKMAQQEKEVQEALAR